jgi:26S proteasome regulatory subunit T5
VCARRYDSRVKAFEMEEKPTEDYSDIGGLDKQIQAGGRTSQHPAAPPADRPRAQELIEAIVRPMTHKHLFDAIGITPPKGGCQAGRQQRPLTALACRRADVRPSRHGQDHDGARLRRQDQRLLPQGASARSACRARLRSLTASLSRAQLAATQLVQMFIGDGAKMVRDAFALAREKAPAIIFVRAARSPVCN